MIIFFPRSYNIIVQKRIRNRPALRPLAEVIYPDDRHGTADCWPHGVTAAGQAHEESRAGRRVLRPRGRLRFSKMKPMIHAYLWMTCNTKTSAVQRLQAEDLSLLQIEHKIMKPRLAQLTTIYLLHDWVADEFARHLIHAYLWHSCCTAAAQRAQHGCCTARLLHSTAVAKQLF